MRSPFEKLRRQLPILLVSIGIQLLVGWLLASIYLHGHNTLAESGRWLSTKPTLEKGLMGAFSFLTERQTLAQDRLNLDAWHGFNEVTYAEPLT